MLNRSELNLNGKEEIANVHLLHYSLQKSALEIFSSALCICITAFYYKAAMASFNVAEGRKAFVAKASFGK